MTDGAPDYIETGNIAIWARCKRTFLTWYVEPQLNNESNFFPFKNGFLRRFTRAAREDEKATIARIDGLGWLLQLDGINGF